MEQVGGIAVINRQISAGGFQFEERPAGVEIEAAGADVGKVAGGRRQADPFRRLRFEPAVHDAGVVLQGEAETLFESEKALGAGRLREEQNGQPGIKDRSFHECTLSRLR